VAADGEVAAGGGARSRGRRRRFERADGGGEAGAEAGADVGDELRFRQPDGVCFFSSRAKTSKSQSV
jgi:hypothetical protein